MHRTEVLKPCHTCAKRSRIARWRSIPQWETEGYVCPPCERDLAKRGVTVAPVDFDWS